MADHHESRNQATDPRDAQLTAQVFDLLLGDNLQGRKDYIANNGAQYLELADLS